MNAVTIIIKKDGSEIGQSYNIYSLDVIKEFNKIPLVELHISDGSKAKGDFAISGSDQLEPGSEIEIQARYESQPESLTTLFKGIVLKQQIKFQDGGTSLTVELSDKAFLMTTARKRMVYNDMTDADIADELISNSELEAGDIEATELSHMEMIQNDCTDWDFLICRAEANGLLVLSDDGVLSLKKPDLSASADHTLEFGIDEILGFNFEADARAQVGKINSFHWDEKQAVVADKSESEEIQIGYSIDVAGLSEVLKSDEVNLKSIVTIDDKESASWATAELLRKRISLFRGWIEVPGSGEYKVGDMIELSGLGNLFNGSALITGIRHALTNSEWHTFLQIGLDAKGFAAQRTDIMSPPAAGLVPGVHGLQLGRVAAFEEDPEKRDRIKVLVHAFNDEKENAVWCRLGRPDAGTKSGVVFYPEENDEVVIGFLNSDPRQGIVLGSLHSPATASPVKIEEKNPKKGIFSRKGFKLLFDDEEQNLVLSTSEKNQIKIDEKKGTIEISDSNKNKITLDKNGITISTDKDLTLEAKGTLKMKAPKIEHASS